RVPQQSGPLRVLDFNTLSQRLILAAQFNGFEGVLDDQTQIVDFKRLRDVVVRAAFYGLDREPFRPVRSNDYHQRRNALVVCALQLCEKVESADSGEIDVEQDEIEVCVAHQSARGFGALSFANFATESLQHAPDSVPGRLFIIDN